MVLSLLIGSAGRVGGFRLRIQALGVGKQATVRFTNSVPNPFHYGLTYRTVEYRSHLPLVLTLIPI